MRRLLAVAMAACAVGCAGTAQPGPGPSGGPAYVDATGADLAINVRTDAGGAPQVVPAAPDPVLLLLPDVYAELGITGAGADAATRTVGRRGMDVRRTFAGERVSFWLDCGRNVIGEQVADVYRVQISLRSTVTPSARQPGSSDVRTVVEAIARTVEGNSTSPVRCVSTGRLESRIGTMLRLKVVS